MAVSARDLQGKLSSILDGVASEISRRKIEVGDASGAKAVMRVELENNVKRVVQVYWTPFQAEIPGDSVGLHLEIQQPSLHWVEGYISPDSVSWIFCFHEREDGDVQLAYYQQLLEPAAAIEAFFNLAAWYALTPCDLTWSDTKCWVSPDLEWKESHKVRAAGGSEMDKAIQESLKKSTIVWLRWKPEGGSERTMPVWFIYQNDKIYVLSGERQQTIPGARDIRRAEVILRWKGKNAQVADLPARVRVLGPGEEWDTIAEKIAEKRLNIPGLPEDTARRWRDSCDILELTLD